MADRHAARTLSLASSAMLAAGRSSPSHADIRARRCGSSQCGQFNRVISRGRSAKLAGSRSNPVSTWCPVRGQTKLSTAIITYLTPPDCEAPVCQEFMTKASQHQRRITARQADALTPPRPRFQSPRRPSVVVFVERNETKKKPGLRGPGLPVLWGRT
jgi:hypothetical protein